MIASLKKEAEAYAAAFATIEQVGDSLLERRRAAFERFGAEGFPTFRDEAWKYTPLNGLARLRFDRPVGNARVDRAVLARLCYGKFDCSEMVFVDGHFAPAMSHLQTLPEGTIVTSLRDALKLHGERVRALLADDAGTLEVLNSALMEDGAFIWVPAGAKVEAPIHLLFHTASGQVAVHPRIIVVAEKGSQVTVVETWVAEGGTYFNNAVTDVYVRESARVDHYKIQRESRDAFHIANLRLHSALGATFRSFFVSTGGKLVRNEIQAPLEAEGVTCQMFGLYMLEGEQHCDNHSVITHAMPRCKSEQVYKGILDGASHGVFSGTVMVSEDAQKTDAHQHNKNLLLSDDAVINTRPQLQILADDVKCTHGVAIGSLDEKQFFYLRSRGIGPEEARNMLTYAFASELLSKIEIDAVRIDVEARISEELAADNEQHRGERR